jgi:hypothetical protein
VAELRRAGADAVGVAYLVATLLAVVQVLLLDASERILRGVVPYLLALFVVLIVRVAGPRDESGFVRWLHGLSWAGVLLSIWLLVAFLGALPAGIGERSGFYSVKVAVTSPIGDHNTAAGVLLPLIVATAAASVRDPRWRLGMVVTTLGLVATLSRGAALILLGLALLGLVVASDRRFRLLLMASAMAAVALVLSLALFLDASPPEGAAVPDGAWGASVVGRVDLAVRGFEVGLEHPVLGVGIGGFQEMAADLPSPNDHAHQALGHAFAEGGVPLLAVTLVVPVVLGLRLLRVPTGPREVLLLAGLGLVLHAQIEILAGRVGYEVVLALLAGLAGALSQTDAPELAP